MRKRIDAAMKNYEWVSLMKLSKPDGQWALLRDLIGCHLEATDLLRRVAVDNNVVEDVSLSVAIEDFLRRLT